MLPADAKVLLLYEPRSLGARRPTQPDAILDEFAWRLDRAQNEIHQVATEMRAEGFTHLLVSRRGVELAIEIESSHHQPEHLVKLDQLLQEETTWLWASQENSYQLYELNH